MDNEFFDSLLKGTVNLTSSTFKNIIESNLKEELQKRKAEVEQMFQIETNENDNLNYCTYTYTYKH